MKWTAPPDRREVTLILSIVIVFIFSYNLDISFRLLGLDAVSSKLGAGGSAAIDKDGRKPFGLRDSLENIIFGDWPWDKGHVAGSGAERSQKKGTGRYGAQWLGRSETGDVSGEIFGKTSVNDVLDRWDTVPRTKVIKHTPGYTILDSLVLFNGSVYIIEDDHMSIPSIGLIASQKAGGESDWKVISGSEAKILFGSYGGKISGVTFLSNDETPNNSTLISLWRTYSSLDLTIDAAGQTVLPPPHRLIFTRIPVFLDRRDPPVALTDVRRPCQTGFHPSTAKASFPALGIMFEHDWADYHLMRVPFIFERVVIADRAAAGSVTEPAWDPVFTLPFVELSASKYWWEPVRRSLALYLGLDGEVKTKKPVITYVQNQVLGQRPQLRDTDHGALVDALKKMGKDYGYEIHIISDTETPWVERMKVIAKSTIMLGVHGHTLLDSVYMKPARRTTLMEFFPVGSFTRDREVPLRALGIRYIAWWNDRKLSDGTLPPVVEPRNDQEVFVNVQAVISTIKEVLTHHP